MQKDELQGKLGLQSVLLVLQSASADPTDFIQNIGPALLVAVCGLWHASLVYKPFWKVLVPVLTVHIIGNFADTSEMWWEHLHYREGV